MRILVLPVAILCLATQLAAQEQPATPAPATTPATTPAPVAAPAASASSSPSDGFRLGLTFSPNTAWLRSDDKELSGEGSRVGYTWGLIADIPFGAQGNYAFHTGLRYNSIGGMFKVDYLSDNGAQVTNTYDLALTYLELPLALKLRANTSGLFNFYGLIGMNGAVNLKAKADFTVAGTTTEDENVTDDIAALKIGFQGGAGLEMNLSSVTLFGGLTYNAGLTNVLDKGAKRLIDENDNKKLLADYVELSLGIFF